MKRANGTGSIVKLPGNRRKPWAVRVPARNERGRIRQHYLSYHAKAADAQLALDDWCRTHQGPEPSAANWTLQQVYDAWSERKFDKLSPQAIAGYKADWNYIKHLSNRKMRLITVDQWQDCLTAADKMGKAPSTVEKVKSLMRALNRYAYERDIITKCYSEFTDKIEVVPVVKKDSLNDLQLAKLIQLVNAGEPWADVALILCYTGLRIAELLQLTPSDYHPNGGCDYIICGLKTEAGKNRIVPIHPKIKPYFLAWLAKGGEAIICKKNGTRISTNYYRRLYKKIMVQIGAPEATPHWSRYTFANNLHMAEADKLSIVRMMGHSDKGITDKYKPLSPEYLMSELIKWA